MCRNLSKIKLLVDGCDIMTWILSWCGLVRCWCCCYDICEISSLPNQKSSKPIVDLIFHFVCVLANASCIQWSKGSAASCIMNLCYHIDFGACMKWHSDGTDFPTFNMWSRIAWVRFRFPSLFIYAFKDICGREYNARQLNFCTLNTYFWFSVFVLIFFLLLF